MSAYGYTQRLRSRVAKQQPTFLLEPTSRTSRQRSCKISTSTMVSIASVKIGHHSNRYSQRTKRTSIGMLATTRKPLSQLQRRRRKSSTLMPHLSGRRTRPSSSRSGRLTSAPMRTWRLLVVPERRWLTVRLLTAFYPVHILTALKSTRMSSTSRTPHRWASSLLHNPRCSWLH